MFQYNNGYLPLLRHNKICQSYPLRTIIIADEWIYFTHFIDENKDYDFIFNTSNIRKILSNADKLNRDWCINTERYEEIMVHSFLRKISELINKFGINMALIDICIAINDVKKTQQIIQQHGLNQKRDYIGNMNNILIIMSHLL